MPKVARLISTFSTQEVATIFSRAKRVLKESGLVILASPSLRKDFGRILVITAAQIGTAPERNRIRRRLKSIFYQEKLFELGYDIVILVRKEAMPLSFDRLKRLLTKACEQIPAHFHQ